VPSFRPFRGLRFDTRLVSLGDVIAPPYDVVDDRLRPQLASRSEFNSILVELPVDDPSQGEDRYQSAARVLSEWKAKGVLALDPEPAFYGYRMVYSGPGGSYETTGVLGALELVEPGAGILPHEETMPKPKGDRLYLLRATRTNTSPIWGLSMAEGLTDLCAPPEDGSGVVSATDDEGVTHQLWAISEPSRCAEIARAVASTPVVIADGHHRYETALAFSAEDQGGLRGVSGSAQPEGSATPGASVDSEGSGDLDGSGGGSGAVMAFVVELSADQLHVRTIHRVVSGLGQGFDLVDHVADRMAAERFGGDPAALTPELLVDQGAIALVTKESAWLLRDSSRKADEGGGDQPGRVADVLSELDSVRVRSLLANLPPHELDYEARWPAALDLVMSGRASAAFMIRPVTVDQIGRAARAGVRMPPKTTFFHPKPRTGMVFRPLD